MRFGRWAAAAAAMVLAGQASAARYYEFQVTGSAIGPNTTTTINYDNPSQPVRGTYTLVYTSVDTFVYDTVAGILSPEGNLTGAVQGTSPTVVGAYDPLTRRAPYYNASSNYGIQVTISPSTARGSIAVLDRPGGPDFGFSFGLADVGTSDSLKPLSTSDDRFTYVIRDDPRYAATVETSPGVLLSVLARTTDIAPSSLQATEQLSVTILPEPAAWVMLILGFGAVGATMRRRRGELGSAHPACAN